MMENSFKKAVGVATVFAVLAYLTPEFAQAQRVRSPGPSSLTTVVGSPEEQVPTIDFTIRQGKRIQSKQDLGYFPKAIKNFTFVSGGVSNNVFICGRPICQDGNVRVTKLTTDNNGNISNLRVGINEAPITLAELQSIFNSKNPSGINFYQDVIRFDVTFDERSSKPALVWFVQSNGNNDFIYNLSSLTKVRSIQAMLPSRVKISYGTVKNNSTFPLTVSQQTPESNTKVGLLGLGALGVVAIYQRHQCRKSKSNF
ncbi:hypothetical protein H6G76_10120 [Nostoc sp. FACHB-152]|uniref:hypothetical protein n=1 Tax=unclassified Nostoc TaxID=2593658 RepID=UPI0016839A10|nr:MULTISPECIES: hypothetical protein [unclassified Nostoc]MBD2447521.1 hypothetical protein [Nostoc sp. FACHB-152]MBD2473135.1 hypothetical protein [Nostoc sp. FACHB-145]